MDAQDDGETAMDDCVEACKKEIAYYRHHARRERRSVYNGTILGENSPIWLFIYLFFFLLPSGHSLPNETQTTSFHPISSRSMVRTLIHSLLRVDFKGRRLWSAALALVILVSVFLYQDESSLNALGDKLNYLNSKLDNWQREKDLVDDHPKTGIDITEDKVVNTDGSFSIRAAIVLFARNSDLIKVLETMYSVEDRFNKLYHYDWVLISDNKHSSTFERLTTAQSSGKVQYIHIPKSPHLTFPASVDRNKMKETKKALKQKKVDVVKSQREKHVQRFWSSDIFNMDFMKDYDYYMKLDPGAWFYCDLDYDPFQYMKEQGKVYAFAFAQREKPAGLPSLWPAVLSYIEEYPKDVHPNYLADFVSDDHGETFNGCQFRTGFEVGDLSFFRGEKYQRMSKKLVEQNGIYYEMWDDSSIRTMGVVLLEDRKNIHFLHGVGYADLNKKRQLRQCPMELDSRMRKHCTCNALDDITWDATSCLSLFYSINGVELPSEVLVREAEARKVALAKEQLAEKQQYEQEQKEKEKQREAQEVEELQRENGAPPEVKEQEGEPEYP